MLSVLSKRLLLLVPSVFGVVTVAFFLIHLIPGDPIEMMLGEQASSVNKQALRQTLGLDLPLNQQYTIFLTKLTRGDLGQSLRSNKPVATQLVQHASATVQLAAVAFGLALIFGMTFGILAAINHGRAFDRLVLVLSSFGVSMPVFWLAPLLVYVFAIKLNWLPVSEKADWSSFVLPGISLAWGATAYLSRMTRAAMIEVIEGDYVRTARAKGLSEFKVYFKHALRNAMLPVITVLGLQLGSLLTGAIVTETIFDWPGIGSLFYNAINNRDYPVVQGCVIFIAVVYLLVNLLTDLSYGFLDPRVRR